MRSAGLPWTVDCTMRYPIKVFHLHMLEIPQIPACCGTLALRSVEVDASHRITQGRVTTNSQRTPPVGWDLAREPHELVVVCTTDCTYCLSVPVSGHKAQVVSTLAQGLLTRRQRDIRHTVEVDLLAEGDATMSLSAPPPCKRPRDTSDKRLRMRAYLGHVDYRGGRDETH